MANCSMFDRKYIALEVLSNCEFLSNQMFDRKNIALCLTEPLCQTKISTDILSNQRFDRTSQKCQKCKYFTKKHLVLMGILKNPRDRIREFIFKKLYQEDFAIGPLFKVDFGNFF